MTLLPQDDAGDAAKVVASLVASIVKNAPPALAKLILADSKVESVPPAATTGARPRRTVWFAENTGGWWMGRDKKHHTRDPNDALSFDSRDAAEAFCEQDRKDSLHPGDPRFYNPTEHIFFGDDEIPASPPPARSKVEEACANVVEAARTWRRVAWDRPLTRENVEADERGQFALKDAVDALLAAEKAAAPSPVDPKEAT